MTRTLQQMQNRPTSYEVAVTANGQTTPLAYSQRKTKRALLNIAQANGTAILDLLGDWDGEATYNIATGWTFGPARIHFTGRTERDVANH